MCLVKQSEFYQVVKSTIANAWAALQGCLIAVESSELTVQQQQMFDNCRLRFRVDMLITAGYGLSPIPELPVQLVLLDEVMHLAALLLLFMI